MRLLVVSENKSRVFELKKTLQDSYMVDTLDLFDQVLQYASQISYNAIILDFQDQSNRMSTIIKRIRENGVISPILLLSTNATPELIAESINDGADDHLKLPYARVEFEARVKALTRRVGKITFDDYSYDDLKYVRSTQDIVNIKTGKLEHLMAREAELMQLFILNPEVLLSKEQIMKKIWGINSIIGDNNLEVYISFLRSKMKKIGSKCQIISRKRLGYYLKNDNIKIY